MSGTPINVLFFKPGDQTPINMQLKDDMMFAEVALKYFGKAGIDQVKDDPKFLFNSKELKTDSYKSLADLGIKNMSRIDVVIGKDVIGA